MASISKYSTNKGTKWRVSYRDELGKSKTKAGFRTKAQAQAWIHQWETDKIRGEAVDDRGATVDYFVKRWKDLKTPTWSKSWGRSMGVHIDKNVLPYWEGKKVANVRRADVQEWVNSMAATYAPKTIKHMRACLKGSLDLAVEEAYIKKNPCEGITLPRPVPEEKIFLTLGQVKTLSEKSKYPLIVLLLGTVGLRWNEVAGLRVRNVDLENRRIHIRQGATTVDTEVVETPLKTANARRDVVFGRFMVEPLRKLVEERREAGGDDAFLFIKQGTTENVPLKLPSNKGWFDYASRRAHDEDPAIPADLTPHDLRHVAAGLLVGSGATVLGVQRQLGHASAAMTLDIYAGLWDTSLDDLSDSMSEQWDAL